MGADNGWTDVGRWDFGLTPPDVVGLCRRRKGEVLNEDRFTVVLRYGELVFKHRAESLLLRLRSLSRGSSLIREHQGLEQLSSLGLRTVEGRAAAARFSGPLLVEELLVTTYREGMTSLGYARREKRPVDRAIVIPALTKLGKDLKRVHDAGYFVNTLADRNVLVGLGGQYAVLDVANFGRRGSREFDLALIDKGLRVTLSPSDRRRLLAEYLGPDVDPKALDDFAARVAQARRRIEKTRPLAVISKSLNRWLRQRSFLRSQLR